MTNRNGRRGWLAGMVFLLLAVCALMVPVVPARAATAAPCHEQAAVVHETAHATSHAAAESPLTLTLTAAERGGDAARRHAGICAVAVCPLMHAALMPAAFSSVHPVTAGPAAPPFLPLQRGIGVPPPLPPPRPSI